MPGGQQGHPGVVGPLRRSSLSPMEIPPPDAKKLLNSWMEWERGEVTPGRAMANLKTGGLPVLLEGLVSAGAADGEEDGADEGPSAREGEARLRS